MPKEHIEPMPKIIYISTPSDFIPVTVQGGNIEDQELENLFDIAIHNGFNTDSIQDTNKN